MHIWSSIGLVAALVQLATMAVQYANTRSIGILCCLVRRPPDAAVAFTV